MCEQKPYPVWLLCRRESHLVWYEHSVKESSAPDWNLPIAPGIYLNLPMVPAGYLKHVIYESVECHRVTHGRKQDTGIN